LKNERGAFYDPDTGFRLRGGKAKPHPPAIGKITREWIAAGGIVVFDENPPPPSPPEPEPEVSPFEERVQKVMDKYGLAELRAKLRDNEIKFSWNAKEQNLAEKLVEAGVE
jgi:hypothetical protein